jgi:Protein of unknown function (DUF2934)
MRRLPTSHSASKTAALYSRSLERRERSRGAVETIERDETAPDMPFEEGAHDTLDPDLRHRMISEAAYHLYAQRGYADGYDLDDWLQAEGQVDHTSLSPVRGDSREE